MLIAAENAPRRLQSLTGLRALAAFAVFLFHLRHNHVVIARRFFDSGYVGVGFFFVLSGFVLTWSAGANPVSASRFYRNRLARIYPAYLVCLIVAAALPITSYARSVEGVVADVFMVQAWFPSYKVTYGLDAVEWSVSAEMFFYLLFPFILRWFSSASTRLVVTVVGVYWALTALVVVGIAESGGPGLEYIAYSQPWIRLGEFGLGVAAAVWIRRKHQYRFIPRSLSVLLVAAAYVVGQWLHGYEVDVVIALPFTIMICAFATAEIRGRSGFVGTRMMVYAGTVSYAFYLVHEITIINIVGLVHAPSIVRASVCFVTACIAAVALHHLIERPFERQFRVGHRLSESDQTSGRHAAVPPEGRPGLTPLDT